MTAATAHAQAQSRTLVFVHGYLDGPEVWQPLLDQLVVPGWRTVIGQLQAALQPSSSSGEVLEHYAQQILEQASLTGQSRAGTGDAGVVFVGHSMGAQVAELAALQLGSRLGGLVRITPAPLAGYPLPPEVLARFEARALLTDPAAIGAGKHGMAKALDQTGADILVRATLATGPATALEQLHAWTGGHPAGHEASALAAPVLTVATDDVFFTAHMLEEGARRFNRRSFEHVTGAGHWPQLEQSSALARVLERFLNTLR